MLNYTQFFPTGSGGGSGGGSGIQSLPSDALADYRNREIFTGPYTETWSVPDGVTEVEVHVWGGGGGGSGCCYGGGGGGGGYARTRLKVTSDDSLSITVGGNAGTSSVTVPTQSPGSPVSSTGGSNGSSSSPPSDACNPTGFCYSRCICGGAGGTGSVSLASPQPKEYCYTASGGAGGVGGCLCMDPTYPNPSDWGSVNNRTVGFFGSGGAAGSPRGNGGGDASESTSYCGGNGGGGIGGHSGSSWVTAGNGCQTYYCSPGPGTAINICYGCGTLFYGGSGGGSFGNGFTENIAATRYVPNDTCPMNCGALQVGGAGKEVNYSLTFQGLGISNPNCGCLPSSPSVRKPMVMNEGSIFCGATPVSNEWWRVEDIGGAGGTGANAKTSQGGTPGYAGGGGGGWSGQYGPLLFNASGIYLNGSCTERFRILPGSPGGFLGGGGSGAYVCQQCTPPSPFPSFAIHSGERNGMGGYAGGSNGSAPGTPGVVIIYW